MMLAACAATAASGIASAGEFWDPAVLMRRVGTLVPTNVSSAGPSTAEDRTTIERVLDGDTVIARGIRERVRLANIDAPEMSHGYGQPGQPYSVQSTNWLTKKVEGKQVTMRCVDRDHYGRAICDLYLGGEHVNREMARAGMAWANTASARFLRDKSVLAAQREAQAERRGLWSAFHAPVPPWRWRKDCWQGRDCPAPAAR